MAKKKKNPRLAISKTAAEKGAENCFQGCRPDKIILLAFVRACLNRTPMYTQGNRAHVGSCIQKVASEDFEEGGKSSIFDSGRPSALLREDSECSCSSIMQRRGGGGGCRRSIG